VQKCLGTYAAGDVVPYAVKVYNKQHLNVETQSADPTSLKLVREIDRLREVELPLWGRIRHPNIVTAFTLYETPKHQNMYLMMQLADLGAIASYDSEFKFTITGKVYEFLQKKLGEAAGKE